MRRARPQPQQPQITSDLSQEFEAHTQYLLRTRFIWFSGTMTVFGGLVVLVLVISGVIGLFSGPDLSAPLAAIAGQLSPTLRSVLSWLFAVTLLVTYASCLVGAKRNAFPPHRMLLTSYLLVMADGLLQVSMDWAGARGTAGLFAVMITHIIACSFLPWTATQALRPIVPVLILNAALAAALSEDGLSWLAVKAPFSLLIAVPGVLICVIRHSRRTEEFKLAFFQRRYGEVRRELFDARRIHEALFPAPIKDGPVQFSYVYEPMHQIGGDYLYTSCAAPGKPLSIVLMDVTGHGIPAALTVNRLHGELQRLFAENPGIGPGEVLASLNRYVYLTLANHAVFVTALCLRADPEADTLEYASGGHPSAYLRGVNGTVHDLPSTSLLLGVSPDAEFAPDPVTLPFHPGDTLIAYTDGAIEARDQHGRMFSMTGMQRVIAGMPRLRVGEWPQSLIHAVEQHRSGPPADDTLVIEISRPVAPAPPTPEVTVPAKTSRPQPV
ncbi:MAG TPA: PP2C family protein-serine/threonine phosphatase [Phycisphaerales bacterium]|nr:PP2C family protein-serine/threonine phosphatase [Phycisphaerales bacterium]